MACKYSLIIPVYQVKEYIVECLESIFCQIPADVQVILVDDGSTDGSGEICDEYARKYPQIEVIHQENKGVAAARNAGLAAAKGEYLLWVDPDDKVEKNWFSAIDVQIRCKAPDILIFDYFEIRDGSIACKRYGRTPGWIESDLFLADIARDVRIKSSLWDKVMRRNLFAGIWFDENLRCLEDYELLDWLILKAKSVFYLEAVLYDYRIRTMGLVRTRDVAVSYQSYLVAQKRRQKLQTKGKACPAAGLMIQAKEFCRNYYLAGCPSAYKKELSECRQALRRDLPKVLLDREIPLKIRASACAFCVPGLSCLATAAATCCRLKQY